MNTATFLKGSLTIAEIILLIATIASPASAAIITFNSNFAMSPSQLDVNLDNATEFDAAANTVGINNLINFETVPLNIFNSLSVAPGVIATLINNDGGRISSEPNTEYGYNTTSDGSQFLQFRPTFGISTASLNFNFVEPIQGFGAYFTGLGTAAGNLNVIFNDGTNQQLLVTGNPFGGSQFWGFISPGSLINNISLSLNGVTSLSRDIFGLDDIRYIKACSMQQLSEN
ncbi:MAG: hypothetical protein WBG73_01610 [Coleofasciculaceae cyanobacterium]